MIDPTEPFSLFSLFWNSLEAHCFHYFLTDAPTKQSKQWASRFFQNSGNSSVCGFNYFVISCSRKEPSQCLRPRLVGGMGFTV